MEGQWRVRQNHQHDCSFMIIDIDLLAVCRPRKECTQYPETACQPVNHRLVSERSSRQETKVSQLRVAQRPTAPKVYRSNAELCYMPTRYMTWHFPPPAGLSGSCDFSISAIIISNALATLVLFLALVSTQPHLSSCASFCPCSGAILRFASATSLLLPTITIGTESAPCRQLASVTRSGSESGHQMIQYLVADNGDHLKALWRGDTVDKQVAMQADELAWMRQWDGRWRTSAEGANGRCHSHVSS